MSQTLKTDVINITLDTGATVPFRAATAKNGNRYFATLSVKKNGERYYNFKYGVNVVSSVVGGSLPTTATLPDGTVVAFEHSTNKSGNPVARASAKVTIDKVEKMFRLSISQLPSGDFNVNGAINSPGGSTGGPQAVTGL